MRVVVDQEKCCASGNCVMTAPQVFDQREQDGIVVLRQAHPPSGPGESARRAAARCPCEAIRIEGE